ncbi:MAG: metallophosphoesterase [Acidobacteriia bacterium]|nr:metallophosphoesterase [Terriglobia bacterium]
MLVRILLSAALLAVPAFCQDGESLTVDPVLTQLPAALRMSGHVFLSDADAAKRSDALRSLARSPEGQTFLTRILGRMKDPKMRMSILDRIGGSSDVAVLEALRHHAVNDPDAKVSMLALEKLDARHADELVQLAEKRLAHARESGNKEDLRKLADHQERWITRKNGGEMPSFMRAVPALFRVKPAGQPIRALAFGDYGQGTDLQRNAAAAMLQYHKQKPFDFAVTLGDNFYSKGMESPWDPRWKTWWDDLYNPLGIPFYVSLGNHDWGLPGSPAAEWVYGLSSPSWKMPSTRYTFTAGAAQFFALDTDVFSHAQALWLAEELDKSTAKWKVVYAHHPIYSHGQHGNGDNLIEMLLPVLKGRADIYLVGHEHDMQHLKPEGGVHLFIAGSGGARPRPITPGERSLFAASSNGFAVLDITDTECKVSFFDSGLKALYEYKLSK